MFQQLKFVVFACLVFLCVAAIPVSAFAEIGEINPYAGYVWPGNFTGIGDFKGSQVFGVRGGAFVGQAAELHRKRSIHYIDSWKHQNRDLPGSAVPKLDHGSPAATGPTA